MRAVPHFALVVVEMVLLGGIALSQLVDIGPPDPDYCFRVEKIRPNLVLKDSAHITGRVADQTTAPFKNSRIELRKYLSGREQKFVRAVTTDKDGRFDLGSVEPGKYRLLASSSRAFAQPEEMKCEKQNCELEITLKVNPTDQPASQCPIR